MSEYIAVFVSLASFGMTFGAGLVAVLCLIGFSVKFVINLFGKETLS